MQNIKIMGEVGALKPWQGLTSQICEGTDSKNMTNVSVGCLFVLVLVTKLSSSMMHGAALSLSLSVAFPDLFFIAR